MTATEIIEAIKALSEVVKANRSLFGDESLVNEANDKIKELIKNLEVKTEIDKL